MMIRSLLLRKVVPVSTAMQSTDLDTRRLGSIDGGDLDYAPGRRPPVTLHCLDGGEASSMGAARPTNTTRLKRMFWCPLVHGFTLIHSYRRYNPSERWCPVCDGTPFKWDYR
jgi:hypothetical protein